MKFCLYVILEDDPRSTPGHLKVLNQIRSIMKLLIVASTVGLTKKLTKNFIFQHPLKSLKSGLAELNIKGEHKKGTKASKIVASMLNNFFKIHG